MVLGFLFSSCQVLTMIAAPVWILSRPRVGTFVCIFMPPRDWITMGKGCLPFLHHTRTAPPHCRGKQKYRYSVFIYAYKKNTYYI